MGREEVASELDTEQARHFEVGHDEVKRRDTSHDLDGLRTPGAATTCQPSCPRNGPVWRRNAASSSTTRAVTPSPCSR